MPMLPLLLVTLAVEPPLPPADRTPPALKAVAQVLLLEGSAQGLAARGTKPVTFPLARGTLLDATDTVRVPANAWAALLLLSNNHVVRLDDDLSLKVSELALFDAPPHQASATAQLERLLSPKERTTHAERLIGWHAGQSAANTVPTTQEKAQEQQRKKSGAGITKETAAPPLRDAPKNAVAPRAPSLAAAPPPPGPSGTKRPPGAARDTTQAFDDLAGIAPEGGATREEAKSAERSAPRLTADDRLEKCLGAAVGALSTGAQKNLGKSITVELRWRDDAPWVRLPLGLPPPACALEWAGQHRAALTARWTPLQVSLR